MFEPIIKTDISNLPKNIETNLDDLEPLIAEREDFAKNLIVDVDSEESLIKADADAALLTKMEKRISRFRIDWTKAWQSPFESVIAKCKAYETRLRDAASNLREKTEVGKEKIRNAKRDRLLVMWGEKTKESGMSAPHFVTFFEMMTDTDTTGCWLNKGITLDKVSAAMDEEIIRCQKAVEIVNTTYSAETEEIKSKAWIALREHFDVTEAIAAVNAYKAEQAELAEAKRADEERKVKKEVEHSAAPVPATEQVAFETYTLQVTGTRAALVAMKAWCAENGVTLKRA